MNEILIKIAIVFAAVVIGLGSYYFSGQKNNPVELVAEEVIKKETGLDIDLTPVSKN